MVRTLFRFWLVSCCLFAAFFIILNGNPAVQAAETAAADIVNIEINVDTLWKGEVTVQGRTTVLPGTTLTIAPNTTVRFGEGAGLFIKGNISALGEPNSPITFTSLTMKKPSAWYMVELQHAAVGEFAHAIFEYAEWGLHSDFSTVQVRDSHFRNNKGGMKFMSGLVEIKHCIFESNEIGIRWRNANGQVENNIITKNTIGVFIKEKGGNLLIKNNDILANKEYNVRVGDFVDADVNIQENWWGPGNPGDTIYDGRKEPGLGKVLYEPYLTKPVTAATPSAAAKPIVPETIPGVQNLDAKQVKEAVAKGAHVYDVRPEKAVKKGTIPDTENVVYDDSKSTKAVDYDASKDNFDLSRLPADKNAEIVFYCNGDTCWRSYKAAIAAEKAGYKNIKWFRGGVPEWKDAGEPVKTDPPAPQEAK